MVSISLPQPWPVSRDAMLLEIKLKDGVLAFAASTDGKLEATLMTSNGVVIHSIVTPVIEIIGSPLAILTILWSDSEVQAVMIDNTDLGSWKGTGSFIFDSRPASATRATSFFAESESARERRHDLLSNLRLRPNRRDGGQELMLSALSAEADQIEDLLALLEHGKEAHVAGLASRIRLMTIGHPFGLLQHCAAYRRLPLIIYADRHPEMIPPIDDAICIFATAAGIPDEGNYILYLASDLGHTMPHEHHRPHLSRRSQGHRAH